MAWTKNVFKPKYLLYDKKFATIFMVDLKNDLKGFSKKTVWDIDNCSSTEFVLPLMWTKHYKYNCNN